MRDSIPILGDNSSSLNLFGALGLVVAIAALGCALAWFFYLTDGIPRRRTRAIVGMVGISGAIAAVVLFAQGSHVSRVTDERQIAAIAEGWDLSAEDAQLVLHPQGGLFDSGDSYVMLNGRTQKVWLHAQGDRYLLMHGDDKVVPIHH